MPNESMESRAVSLECFISNCKWVGEIASNECCSSNVQDAHLSANMGEHEKQWLTLIGTEQVKRKDNVDTR